MRSLVKVLSLAAVLTLTTACPDDPFQPVEHFTVADYTGLSACGFVLESQGDSSLVLEPLNLTDFIPNPVVGQELWVVYEVEEDAATACMVGPVVTLITVSE